MAPKRPADSTDSESRKRQRVMTYSENLRELRRYCERSYWDTASRIIRRAGGVIHKETLDNLLLESEAKYARRSARFANQHGRPVPPPLVLYRFEVPEPEDLQPRPEAQTQANAQPQVDSQLQADAQVQTVAQTQENAQPQADVQAEMVVQTQTDAQPQVARRPLSYIHNMPVDILNMFLDQLNTETQLRLLVAYPGPFRSNEVNIVRNDANLQGRRMNPGPGGQTDDNEPMLSVAIKRGYNIGVIRYILEMYNTILGADGVNTIYQYRSHLPPLVLAIRASRFDIFQALLERGASPLLIQPRGSIFCGLRGFSHYSRDCGQQPCFSLLTESRLVHIAGWEHPTLRYDDARQIMILLCQRLCAISPAHVVSFVIELFEDVDTDYTYIVGAVVESLIARAQNDPARQNLRSALADIVMSIATHRMSEIRGPGINLDRLGAFSSFETSFRLRFYGRSDQYIRQFLIVWGAGSFITPEQLAAITNTTTQERGILVILSTIQAMPALGIGFIYRFVEQMFRGDPNNDIVPRLRFIDGCFMDFLEDHDHLEQDMQERIVYLFARLGLSDVLGAVNRTRSAARKTTEVCTQALIVAVGMPNLEMLQMLVEWRERDPRAEEINIAGVSPSYYEYDDFSAERDWPDYLLEENYNVLEAAILLNNFEAARYLLREAGADALLVRPQLIAGMLQRRKDIDVAAEADIQYDWTATLPVLDSMPDDIRDALRPLCRRFDPTAFREVLDEVLMANGLPDITDDALDEVQERVEARERPDAESESESSDE